MSFLKDKGANIKVTDISNFNKIKNLFRNIDCVFHLAAMNRAQRSIEKPLTANEWNINGTLNVLEAARINDVSKVINASSSSVYAWKEGVIFREDDRLQPIHPYGVGKLAGEHYTRVYNEIYGLETTTLRYFSVYGPRQLGEMGGFEKGPAWVLYILALLGICYIAIGAFIIRAARDPLKNIMWVQFAIAVAILIVVVAAYSIIRGFVTFTQEGGPLIINAVFAVVFLALYPWRAESGS